MLFLSLEGLNSRNQHGRKKGVSLEVGKHFSGITFWCVLCNLMNEKIPKRFSGNFHCGKSFLSVVAAVLLAGDCWLLFSSSEAFSKRPKRNVLRWRWRQGSTCPEDLWKVLTLQTKFGDLKSIVLGFFSKVLLPHNTGLWVVSESIQKWFSVKN